MKAYLTRHNNDIFDAFDTFFRPFYVDGEASVMKTDITETNDSYVMDVEMAGYDKKNISLNYENGYLTVSAKKDYDEQANYLRRERSCSCSRSYYLGEVIEKDIKATYTNGVLTIVVPKQKPEEHVHSITID